MGKRSGQGTALGALIAAGALCLVSAAAQAATIDVGTGSGAGAVSVSLTSAGATVAGTQNDIVYTGTTIAHSKKCLRTNTMTCTMDSDCPKSDPTNATSAPEPCTDLPACSVSAATGKEGFFSFLKTPGCKPPGCTCDPNTAGDCTAIRAIIVSLDVTAPTTIPDGTLYTCTFDNAGTAAVPLPNSNQKASDAAGVAIAATGADGSVPVKGTINPCCGDSDMSGGISTAEATNAILALVNRTPESDPAAQCTASGQVGTADATKVILNLVGRICAP